MPRTRRREVKRAMEKRRIKPNIPIIAALVLLYLTILSTHLTGGLYARYTTTAAGTDSARVIQFRDITLTETGDFYDTNKLWILPGKDLNKSAKVSFGGSETATLVFLEVTVKTDASEWTVSADGTDYSVHEGALGWSVASPWVFLKESGSGSYVYYIALDPNQALTDQDINRNGKVTVSESITKASIQDMTGITIDFQATAVQSNGFASPEEAWASVDS